MKPRARRNCAAARVAAVGLLAAMAGPVPAAAADTDTDAHADTGWRLSLHSRQHSDATALNLGRDPRAEDLSPRRGRNLAYIDDEVRLERTHGAWTLGLLARSRATLVASADTLALYRQVDGREAIAGDPRWNVDARFRGFSGGGLVFGRGHPLGAGWSARWELQALVLQRWRERRISGTAGATAATAATAGTYDFALTSMQRDSGLRFPFQNAFAARGSALLGGAAVAWQGQRWQFEVAVHDAGWQRWRGLPQQRAVLDSATAAYDADGFLIYRPLIQGQNSQATATQAAPAWGRLAARRRVAPRAGLGAEAGADLLPGFGALPWLGLRLPAANSQLALQWRTHERRLTLQWAWRGLTLTAGADRAGGDRQSREFGLAWALPI